MRIAGGYAAGTSDACKKYCVVVQTTATNTWLDKTGGIAIQ